MDLHLRLRALHLELLQSPITVHGSDLDAVILHLSQGVGGGAPSQDGRRLGIVVLLED